MSKTYFVFRGFDGPQGPAIRAVARPAHQAHIRVDREDCRCVAGGVLVDDDGEAMIGSLLVFEARDRAAVERFMADDPYMHAGLFERVEINRWRWGLGQPPQTDA